MKLKVFNIFLFSFLFTNCFFGQKITFKIISKQNQEPLSLVNVLEGKNYIGFSDVDGVTQVDFNTTERNLTFLLLGFQEVTKKITKDLVNTTITIEMEPSLEKLSEVVLNLKKQELYALTSLKPVEGTHIYAGKKSEVINLDLVTGNKSTNNPRQIFSKVAGLNIYDSNDGGLQLNIGGRGLDPNRTANFNTRQNDYDISADVLGYPESYYTPPTEALSQIQIVRGAASLQYGTQFGGLVNFKIKKPNKNKPFNFLTRNTIASFGTYTNFTQIDGTSNKLSYMVYSNIKKGDGFRPNSGYDSKSFYGYLGYQFNSKTNISIEYTKFYYLAQQAGGLSDVQFLEDPSQSYRERNWFSVDWNLFNAKLNHQFSKNTSASLSLFSLNAYRKAIGFRTNPVNPNANIFKVDSDQQDPITGIFEFNRDLQIDNFSNYGAEARIITNYSIADTNSVLLLGTKFYKTDNNAQQGPGSKGTDADFSFVEIDNEALEGFAQNSFTFPNLNLSFFGENIFNISDKLSITPGFRFEYIKTESEGEFLDTSSDVNVFIEDNNKLDRSFLLLGLGISYKPNDYLESYFNFSQNYRSVTFSDIRTVNPAFAVDPDIKDETGYTFDIGIRGSFTKRFSYDLSAFTLLYDNRIGQRFSTEPPFRATVVRGNIGQASIVGLESLLQWNLKETFFEKNENLKLSVFSNLALTTSEYTSSGENNIKGNEVEFVPKVNLKTGVSFGYKNFLSSLQYTFTSEQFTDATNSPYDPENESNVNGAIPSYDILDLSLSYKFSKHILLEGGINNLLDNSYFTRRATGYPGPGIIPAEPRYYYTTLQIKL